MVRRTIFCLFLLVGFSTNPMSPGQSFGLNYILRVENQITARNNRLFQRQASTILAPPSLPFYSDRGSTLKDFVLNDKAYNEWFKDVFDPTLTGFLSGHQRGIACNIEYATSCVHQSFDQQEIDKAYLTAAVYYFDLFNRFYCVSQGDLIKPETIDPLLIQKAAVCFRAAWNKATCFELNHYAMQGLSGVLATIIHDPKKLSIS